MERIEKEQAGYSGEGEEFSGQKDPVTDIGEMHCILDGDQSRDGGKGYLVFIQCLILLIVSFGIRCLR